MKQMIKTSERDAQRVLVATEVDTTQRDSQTTDTLAGHCRVPHTDRWVRTMDDFSNMIGCLMVFL